MTPPNPQDGRQPVSGRSKQSERVRRVNSKRPASIVLECTDDREDAAIEILRGWLDELRRSRAGSN